MQELFLLVSAAVVGLSRARPQVGGPAPLGQDGRVVDTPEVAALKASWLLHLIAGNIHVAQSKSSSLCEMLGLATVVQPQLYEVRVVQVCNYVTSPNLSYADILRGKMKPTSPSGCSPRGACRTGRARQAHHESADSHRCLARDAVFGFGMCF